MSRKCLWADGHSVGPAGRAPASSQQRSIPPLGLAPKRQRERFRLMRVGFIGLGPIARTMASKLLEAGHQLTLFDPARTIPEDLQSAGGCVADSIQDACRWTDAVFTMLSNQTAAEAVILGPGGVVDSLPRDAIHIGSSTISVESSDRIVEAHWNAGKQYVSGPVVVRTEAAAEGQLLLVAGAREATIVEIEPLLGAIGQLAQLDGWPSDANRIQLDLSDAGANLVQSLARHPALRFQHHRSPLERLPFPHLVANALETKGVLQ